MGPCFRGDDAISTVRMKKKSREVRMNMNSTADVSVLAFALLASTCCVHAAEVTFERLVNPEPHNWLMNHRDYSSQRFSPLDAINKSNVKNLKLAFAVAIGGTAGNEALEATPLVE